MKQKFNDLKDKLLVFIKHKANTITIQLTIGISLIVFSATLIMGLVFLSQYHQLSLKQTEADLREKSKQLAEIGDIMLTSPFPVSKNRLFDSLKGLTDSDFWIIDNNGQAVISTTDTMILNSVYDLNNNFLSMIKSEASLITYDYSKYFGTKTLTVITPIVQNNYLIGAVMLHKDVRVIYDASMYFTALVLISLIISLVLSIILGILYSRYFTRPLKRITEVASEIAKRNYDIKTEIEREDEIGELASTIDTMSDEINQNIKEIKMLEGRAKELVANVSHEFKTPLTMIRGHVENLLDKTTKPSNEVYSKIINNTITLEKLVNELLELSKFQSGRAILKKEMLELGQLVNDVVSDMQHIAKNKKIKLKLNVQYKDNQVIEADYTKLRQLITIFLDNAIKYSDEKSSVTVSVLENEVVVSDNGIGIDKSELEQLFERYYQVDDNEKGYGLGLCIAKYIADAHGFKLVIDSEAGIGTNVHILFK